MTDSDKTVYYWQIYCETDHQNEFAWSQNEPNACPINSEHVISGSPKIIDEISSTTVKIREEEKATQGFYKFSGFIKDIPESNPPGNVSSFSLSWPYPVSIVNGWFMANDTQVNDIMSAVVAENTIIGGIGADAIPGTNTLIVNNTVFEHAYPGFNLNLFNGVTTEDIGELVTKNPENNTITVSKNIVGNTFKAGTYIRMSVPMIEDLHINNPGRYGFAEKKLGGRYMPANTVITLKYKNNEGSAKKFSYNIEILY